MSMRSSYIRLNDVVILTYSVSFRSFTDISIQLLLIEIFHGVSFNYVPESRVAHKAHKDLSKNSV